MFASWYFIRILLYHTTMIKYTYIPADGHNILLLQVPSKERMGKGKIDKGGCSKKPKGIEEKRCIQQRKNGKIVAMTKVGGQCIQLPLNNL